MSSYEVRKMVYRLKKQGITDSEMSCFLSDCYSNESMFKRVENEQEKEITKEQKAER